MLHARRARCVAGKVAVDYSSRPRLKRVPLRVTTLDNRVRIHDIRARCFYLYDDYERSAYTACT